MYNNLRCTINRTLCSFLIINNPKKYILSYQNIFIISYNIKLYKGFITKTNDLMDAIQRFIDENTDPSKKVSKQVSSNTRDTLIKVAYFTGLTGMSITLGFSVSLSKLRKTTNETKDAVIYEEGAALARKALMRGTIYAVCGCTLFAILSYKLFVKKMIQDFNQNTDNKGIR